MKHYHLNSRGTIFLMICFSSILFLASCQKAPDEKREYGWFEFVIPDSDTTRNEVDMSFLNEEIAGSSGFVRIDNGHFIDGKGDDFCQGDGSLL